jgi:hypothetical protein
MSDKFQKDQGRSDEAVASMEGLSDLIAGWGNTFYDALSGAPKVLGFDDFGKNAWHQLNSQILLFQKAILALSQCAGAVPQKLKEQSTLTDRAQQKVVDSIHDLGGYNSEGLPGKGGGVHGK